MKLCHTAEAADHTAADRTEDPEVHHTEHHQIIFRDQEDTDVTIMTEGLTNTSTVTAHL